MLEVFYFITDHVDLKKSYELSVWYAKYRFLLCVLRFKVSRLIYLRYLYKPVRKSEANG